MGESTACCQGIRSRCVDLTLIHPAEMCLDTSDIFINQVKRKTFHSYLEKCLLSGRFLCPKCLGANRVFLGHTLVSSEFVSHPRFLLFLVPPTHLPPLQRPCPSHSPEWKLQRIENIYILWPTNESAFNACAQNAFPTMFLKIIFISNCGILSIDKTLPE